MKEMQTELELKTILYQTGLAVEGTRQNTLETPFMETIVATLQYYDATREEIKEVLELVWIFKNLVSLWLSKLLERKLASDVQDGINLEQVKKLARLYIAQKDVGGFVWWLRGHDMDIEEPSFCQDCIDSYKSWRLDAEFWVNHDIENCSDCQRQLGQDKQNRRNQK